MEDKYIEYANILMENLDIEPKLNEILIKIEELKKEGRKLNNKFKKNDDRRWALAKELGMVETTEIKQGELSRSFADGLVLAMKKEYMSNVFE